MEFSLIICTYMRPGPLKSLLESVALQTLYPNEILIVDGSENEATQKMMSGTSFRNVKYFRVSDADRGLTRQRNFGIARVAPASGVICFLDDDTILKPGYFGELLKTYASFPEASGVGGYIDNETKWERVPAGYAARPNEYSYDGWKRKDGSRFILRKKFGLDSDRPPGFAPEFSNGRSVAFLPPSGKVYPVEQIMGGVSSFRTEVFDKLRFSTYFEGYGLYEDADFCFRLIRHGKLFVNTAARLEHHHASSGRPNQYRYGKMVVRNGWYVWRVRTPKPSVRARFKWHAITLLLAAVRATNAIFGKAQKKQAFTESAGRFTAYFELFFNKPSTPK